MKHVLILSVLAMTVVVGSAAAKTYCTPMPEPKKESDTWFIPETAFTKEAAAKALKDLNDQVTDVSGQDLDGADNALIMIKGYLYRAHLAQHEKDFGSEDVELKKEFCEFLKKKAFVHH